MQEDVAVLLVVLLGSRMPPASDCDPWQIVCIGATDDRGESLAAVHDTGLECQRRNDAAEIVGATFAAAAVEAIASCDDFGERPPSRRLDTIVLQDTATGP